MRIGIDARFYGPEHSGLGRYTTNFIRELSNLPSDHTYYLFLREKYYNSLSFPDNFHKVRLDVPHYGIREQVALPLAIRRYSLNAFHSLHLNAPFIGTTPLIVTIHDLIKNHFKDYTTTTRSRTVFFLKRLGYAVLIRRIFNKAEAIIAPSNFVKNEILKLYNIKSSKIRVLYEAPDPIFLKKTKPSRRQEFLLFVGNAYPHKNIRTLITAFKSVRAQFPTLTLTLATANNEFLKRILSEVDIDTQKHINIVENANDEDLIKLYDTAKTTISPSLMEGFGLVGIESLARGTPLVASDIPVYREVYGDSASYFNPRSASDLATKIVGVIKNPRPVSPPPHKLSWTTLAKGTLEIYDEISTNLRSS